MSEGCVTYEKDGAVGRILFNNPLAQNALSPAMYRQLRGICTEVASDPSVRLLTLRGAGGKAFVSGSDINTFASFQSGRDGVDYEFTIGECIGALEALPVTILAIIDGWAVGAGLILASVSDFRIATPNARFGAPLGRTIANCLSATSCARVASAIGIQAAKRMLLLGEILTAQELLQSGFLLRVVEPSKLDATIDEIRERVEVNAPLTTLATKETIRRISLANMPSIDDLIERVYGSNDFKLGVKTFLDRTKKTPPWSGT